MLIVNPLIERLCLFQRCYNFFYIHNNLDYGTKIFVKIELNKKSNVVQWKLK